MSHFERGGASVGEGCRVGNKKKCTPHEKYVHGTRNEISEISTKILLDKVTIFFF